MALRVTAQLGMDGTGFFRTAQRAEAVMGNLARRVATLFTVSAITGFVRKTMEYADAMEEMAQRLGVGTTRLQEWTFAAKQAGVSTEQLANFVARLNAAAMDPEKVKILKAMGIDPTGMNPEQLFGAVAGQMRGKTGPKVQQALAGIVEVRRLGNIANLLSSDLEAAGEAANRMGAVMDEQTVQILAKLNDQFSILGQILMSQFGPALLSIASHMFKAGGAVEDFFTNIFVRFSRVDWRKAMEEGIRGFAALNPMGAFGSVLKQLFSTQAGAGISDEQKQAQAERDALWQRLLAFTPFAATPMPGAGPGRQPSISMRTPETTGLVGVGNFLGISRNVLEAIPRLQLKELIEIKRNTQEIAQNMGSSPYPPD